MLSYDQSGTQLRTAASAPASRPRCRFDTGGSRGTDTSENCGLRKAKALANSAPADILAQVMFCTVTPRSTESADRAPRRALWAGMCLVAAITAACGASRPPSPAPSPSKPAAAATPKRKRWSEPMQTLRFDSVYGPGSPVWEGNYELSLAGEAYAAECRFKIVDVDVGRSDPETCTGDEVYLLWGVFSVMGITLPERLSAVRVRLVRDGVPLYEGT